MTRKQQRNSRNKQSDEIASLHAPLDRTDRALLRLLQADARMTAAQLAEQVSLTTSPCWRRVRRLEEGGYIRGYRAELDPARLGLLNLFAAPWRARFGVTAVLALIALVAISPNGTPIWAMPQGPGFIPRKRIRFEPPPKRRR